MRILFFALYLLAAAFGLSAQSVSIGTNTPHPGAAFEISSSNKGFLPPRMTWSQIQEIGTPAEGLMVFDLTLHRYRVYTKGKWELLSYEKKDFYDPPGYFAHAIANGNGQITSTQMILAADGGLLISGYYTGEPVLSGITLPASVSSRSMLVKFNANGTVAWLRTLGGGTGFDAAYGVVIGPSGHIYITGNFTGIADLDPTPAIDNHVSNGGSDAYLVKLDGSGNYIWGIHVGGSSNEFSSGVVFDGTSGIMIYGSFGTTVDFDPGIGTSNLVSSGLADSFFAMYDQHGIFSYAKKIGGAGNDYIRCLAISGGTIVLGGVFANICDFDPGPGVTNLSPVGNNDIFFGKYDIAGNLQFVKRVGGSGTDFINDLVVDPTGVIYICGSFEQNCDFDPDAGSSNELAEGFSDGFFAKYTSAGAYISVYVISSADYENVTSVAIDNSGNIIVGGVVNNATTDFHPDPGQVMSIPNYDLNDVYIARYNSTGSPAWVRVMGGLPGSEYITDVICSPNGKSIWITGYTNALKYKNFSGDVVTGNTARYFLSQYLE